MAHAFTRTDPLSAASPLRIFLASALALAASALFAQRAQAANELTPQAYLQYAPTFGDTYNGVTSDDGDHLGGSYSAKVVVLYSRFAASYLYYRDLFASQTNATTSSGAPGTSITYPGATVIVPVFTTSNAESEFRLEYEPANLPVYFGVATSNSFNNYGFPRLTAFGIGVELMPNPKKILSPYASYYYFPNQNGTYPLADPNNPASGSVHSAFIANEIDVGASVAFPKTNLSVVLGYFQHTNVRKTGYFNFVRDGPYVGVGYRIR